MSVQLGSLSCHEGRPQHFEHRKFREPSDTHASCQAVSGFFLRLFLAKVVFRLPDAGKPLRLLRAHREPNLTEASQNLFESRSGFPWRQGEQ